MQANRPQNNTEHLWRKYYFQNLKQKYGSHANIFLSFGMTVITNGSVGARHVNYDAWIQQQSHYIQNTVCMPTITNTVKTQNQYSYVIPDKFNLC